MPTGIETERKFALARGQQIPRLDAIAAAGVVEHYEMVSIYYDTPEYRLNAAHQSIRLRTRGPDAGWQAKLPTDNPDKRLEVQVAPGGLRMPRELRELVAATVGEEPLLPIAELRIDRISRELRAQDGSLLAVVNSDQVCSTVAGRVQEWAEVEVELIDGDSSVLDDVEAVFAAVGILRSPSRSKLSRALAELGARQDEPPAPVGVAQVVGQYLATQIGLLQALEVAVVRDDYDAVHRCRVATRKLRCTLRTFERAFRTAAIRALREDLRWYAEQLGPCRDAEVLRERLKASLATLPAPVADQISQTVLSRIEEQHAQAHQQLVTAMVTDRYRRLQLDLEQLLAAPPLDRMAAEPASVLLPTMLDASVQRAARLAQRAESRSSDLTRWHELRKAAKSVRYGADALVPVSGDQAAAQATAWAAVAAALGEVQDAVIAEQVISDLAWQATAAGESRRPFDDLRSHQDHLLRQALDRSRAALSLALG